MKIHHEGKKILTTIAIISLLLLMILYLCTGINGVLYAVAIYLMGQYLFIMHFFRTPLRKPIINSRAVTAPADGTVVIIEEVQENEYLKEQCIQVSVFMSIFNVHVNWLPVDGVIEYYRYHQGKYMVAWHPKSSTKNERTTVVINRQGTKILLRQIAGFIARRIVCYAKEGAEVEQGKEIGFIKFGSRVDLFLPSGTKINVKIGDKVKGTQTIIAYLE